MNTLKPLNIIQDLLLIVSMAIDVKNLAISMKSSVSFIIFYNVYARYDIECPIVCRIALNVYSRIEPTCLLSRSRITITQS